MGKIMIYAGIAVLVLAVILTVIFKITKPVYKPAVIQPSASQNPQSNNTYSAQTATAETTVMERNAEPGTENNENPLTQ